MDWPYAFLRRKGRKERYYTKERAKSRKTKYVGGAKREHVAKSADRSALGSETKKPIGKVVWKVMKKEWRLAALLPFSTAIFAFYTMIDYGICFGISIVPRTMRYCIFTSKTPPQRGGGNSKRPCIQSFLPSNHNRRQTIAI